MGERKVQAFARLEKQRESWSTYGCASNAAHLVAKPIQTQVGLAPRGESAMSYCIP